MAAHPPPREDDDGPAGRRGDSYVQSFARGLAVLRCFGAATPAPTLAEMAERSGLTRAGARRILLTLQALGYVEQDDRRFRLTPRVMELGFAYLASQPWWQPAQPLMEELTHSLHESTSAAVLDGDQIVYVLRVPMQKIMSLNLGVGSRLPAWCTSMGRVLLASLDEDERERRLRSSVLQPRTPKTVTDPDRLLRTLAQVRRQGWSLVNEELELGLMSLAVPLKDRSGRVMAALNVSSRPQRWSATEMQRQCLPALQSAAERLGVLISK
jgi:IclR family pca regulon transcriptional regulator